MKNDDNVSSPYKLYVHPKEKKDWVPSPNKKPPVKKVKKLSKTNSVNA